MSLNIGERLKGIRTARQMTLEEAAKLTGVSKPMLGQIERGQSVPTVTTLWKIATGLKVPFSVFLEEEQAEFALAGPAEECMIEGEAGHMRAYPLFPFDPVRNVEAFYIEFDGGCRHASAGHSRGVEEYVFVVRGSLGMILGEREVFVGERQGLRFRADIPHTYDNREEEACAVYNVIFYPGDIYGESRGRHSGREACR